MRFSLLLRDTRELWKEWELRLLILLSLLVQLSLATQGGRRKTISKRSNQFLVWTTFLLAESIATVTLGVLSNRLANIKEMKGTFDPKSQITALWASFLLLHLGGPDTITAYALADNELWLRQLARLCVQVGLACYIYYMALSGSTLSMIAKGIILVGFIKYAERTLCLYLASKDRFQDSMRYLPNFGPIYPRKMEQYLLKREEGYQVGFDEVIEFSAPEGLSVSGQAYDKEKILLKAYELFKNFKLLFAGLILNSGDLATSKHIFMDPSMKSENAFEIVEIEFGFMYDLLYTKAPLLNRAWGIIRWVISLSVPCAVLLLFSLQDKKDYPKVDICITFLLVSATILLDIYSLLLVISSDWVNRWRLQKPERSTISSAITSLQFFPKQRWSNSVAQFSLLRFSIRKGNRIVPKYPWLTTLDMKVEKNFYVCHKEFKNNLKDWIFHHIKEMDTYLKKHRRSKRMLETIKLGVSDILNTSNYDELNWREDNEFDQSILIWHIATELCYYQDRGKKHGENSKVLVSMKMSKLVSRYMLYLLVFHPPMLPIGTGGFQYEDTLVDCQKFFEDKQAVLLKKEGSISSIIKFPQKLFKKESHSYTDDCGCKTAHKSRKSLDLCKVCHLLLKLRTEFPAWKMSTDKSMSVLYDGCYLAYKLTDVARKSDPAGKWDVIGNVWARMLVSAACQSKGYEHCESLSTGGELLSHVWLLMAHFGIALPEQIPGERRITKLIMD